MKIEIKSRWDSTVLFTAEAASLLLAVQAAIKSSADLHGANLYGANLRGAINCAEAKNAELAQAQTIIVPEGNLVGWKKCRNNVIVKLLIPQKAKRSNATGRKCRAEYAKVLRIFGAETGVSEYDGAFVYRQGETVKPNNGWDENRFVECGSGIHFYLTRIEAEKS